MNYLAEKQSQIWTIKKLTSPALSCSLTSKSDFLMERKNCEATFAFIKVLAVDFSGQGCFSDLNSSNSLILRSFP